MRSFKFAAVAGVATALVLGAGSAFAAPVYTENFNNSAFVGSSIGLKGSDLTSDRFGATDYYSINNFDGFTFSGTTPLLAQATGTGDGALELNEPSGAASVTLTGLVSGQAYDFSFLLSGDNRPGEAYVLNVNLGGNTTTINGVDGASGSNLGTVEHIGFTPTGTTESLILSQASTTAASPVLDNLSVSAAPEPGVWALMIAGLAMMGGALRLRRRQVGAVAA